MRPSMSSAVILASKLFTSPGPWPGLDPFLFCVHHNDDYPKAYGDSLGPDPKLLRGRDIGSDFSAQGGWSMYHGERVPGFPRHPHTGFETLTVVRRGLVDHSDSLGATARYGQGDAQWLTTGSGVCHSEMFPLVDSERGNPMELFQIWINLPARSKRSAPWFAMFWDKDQPESEFTDAAGRQSTVRVVGGSLAGMTAPAPPPSSWAADPNNHVVVATIKLSAHARWTLPAGVPGLNRMLYFFKGAPASIAGTSVRHGAYTLRSDADAELVAGADEAEFLLLQGRPIGEPVVQQGPFVVNTPAELRQAFAEYRATEFGKWRFADDQPTHPRDAKRFAVLPDGTRIAPKDVETC